MSVDGGVEEQSVYTNDELLVSNKGDPAAMGLFWKQFSPTGPVTFSLQVQKELIFSKTCI